MSALSADLSVLAWGLLTDNARMSVEAKASLWRTAANFRLYPNRPTDNCTVSTEAPGQKTCTPHTAEDVS